MENTDQDNIEKYLNKYEYIAKHLKEIFLLKVSRNIVNKKEEDWFNDFFVFFINSIILIFMVFKCTCLIIII